jgi:hypothetical protein
MCQTHHREIPPCRSVVDTAAVAAEIAAVMIVPSSRNRHESARAADSLVAAELNHTILKQVKLSVGPEVKDHSDEIETDAKVGNSDLRGRRGK